MDGNILGSYQQHQYSQGFQKMMSNVVAKIYKNQGIRQNILKNLIQFTSNDSPFKKQPNKFSYYEQVNQRKNTSPTPSYYVPLPKSNIFNLRSQRNKSLSNSKILDLSNKNRKKTPLRNRTLPNKSERQNYLIQKISDYNTCLMAKTYKFQEKQKLAAYIQNAEQSDRSQELQTISRIRKCELFKKNTRWINSKNKFIQQLPSQKKDQFNPWESDHLEDGQY